MPTLSPNINYLIPYFMIRLNDTEWYYNQGVQRIIDKNYSGAVELLGKLVDLVPDNSEAYYSLGVALSNLGEHELACENYLKVIELDPECSDALFNCGRTFFDLEKFWQACKMFEQFVELEPDSPEGYYLWADCLCRLGLYRKACEKYELAIEVDATLFFVYVNWGLALFNLALETEEGPERAELLDQEKHKYHMAEDIEPGAGSYNLACVYCLEGDFGQCRSWLEKASYTGHLPSWSHAMSDDDLIPVKHKDWFIKLDWQEEEDSEE